MATDPHSVRHAEQRSITNTDQVEIDAINNKSAVITAGIYDERLSGEIDDIDAGDTNRESWHIEDVVLDDEAGPIRDEIVRRIGILGKRYPFEIQGNSLVHLPSKSKFYEYCLGICHSPTITRLPHAELPRTFERVTALIVKLYLGNHSGSFHTGAPRDHENGKTFMQAMEKLSEVSSANREWKWNPDPTRPAAPSTVGDEGIDFVVWKNSLDDRIGQIFIAGQCACGNDWSDKFNDLNEDRLEPWLRKPSLVPFTRCFATPFLMSDGNFNVAHRQAGWTLDRIRLTAMAEAAVDDDEYIPWITQLNQLFEVSQQPIVKAA